MSIRSVLNKVLVFLRLRKKSPSDESKCYPLRESRMFWDFQIFDVPDHNKDPWYVEAYWAVYRFFKYNPLANPRDMYYEVKYFIQRGRRGWSDRDVWSLDGYLEGWLPAALTRLKKTKHGVPCAVFEEEDCGEDGQTTHTGLERASARWDVIMDKMIAAFEAHKRMGEGLYEDELGAYPMRRPTGVSAHTWKQMKDEHFQASQRLRERDMKIWEEGSAAFIKHFGNLWD